MIYDWADEFDSDVLAVVKRGQIEVTFLTAPRVAINDKDYDLVMWKKQEMQIVVAQEYLDDYVDEAIASEIAATVRERYDSDEPADVREMAIKLLAKELDAILNDVIFVYSNDPDEVSFDSALKRLLDDEA
jgi:hypothetical protein